MKNNYKKGEIAKEILKALTIGTIIVSSLALPNIVQLLKFFNISDPYNAARFKKSLKNLNNKKFVKIYEKNGEEVVEITQEGKKRILKYKFDELKITSVKKWDKLWRIIIFDVPETNKAARRALSYKLKEIGCYPLQKSVFVSPFECKNEIDFIGEFFRVRKFIYYFIVKEMENEKYLKQKFNLN